MSILLSYIAARLTEPSTAAGIGLVIHGVQNHDVGGILSGIFGVLGIVLPEGRK